MGRPAGHSWHWPKHWPVEKGLSAAVVSAREVKLVGGDNATEAEVSRSKSQLTRKNLLSRTSPRESHVAALASRRLLQHLGLDGVREALAKAGEDRTGKLGHEPGHFLAIHPDHEWLYE